ncbi:MAG: four helix bundle protein [Verrucomicrobia bacterium]|nr:four helix bundle protein [Verrucomicrobiota bacterium]
MPEAPSQIPKNKGQSSAPIRHFTDLVVWQKAFELGRQVFKLSKDWPREEKYALTDQARRSSRSVSANIAEAWGKRRYEAHFVSKLSDSDTELLETENWLMFARDHGYLASTDFDAVYVLMREIGRMLGSIMSKPEPFLLRDARSRD